MKRQSKPQESKINIIPYDNVKDLRCSTQINYLKNKLHQDAQILNHGEFYIQMPKKFVNSTLFFLLGSLSYLQLDGDKKSYKNETTEKEKDFVTSLFKKIQPLPRFQTQYRQNEFIEHINKHSSSIRNDHIIVEMGIKVWDKLGPKILSKKYPSVFFNLKNYQSSSNHSKKNKKMLIRYFEQTQESTVLCFFETKVQFSINSIDIIVNEALKQQKNMPKIQEKEPITEIQLHKPQQNKDSADSKPKDKPISSKDIEASQPRMNQVKKQNLQQKSSLFQILYFIFLVASIYLIWHQHNQLIELDKPEFNENYIKINASALNTVQNFKGFITPYKQSFTQWNLKYIRPFLDSICETFDKIVTNVTSIFINDLNSIFKAVQQLDGDNLIDNQSNEQTSLQQL